MREEPHLTQPSVQATQTCTWLRLMPARLDEFEAVATLFEALHRSNAALDARFALAEKWRPLLHEHFLRTHADPGALWLLAWVNQEPVGLLLLEAHLDSPLFQQRHWTELVALYVAPAYRGTGLAQHLIREATTWTSQHGFDRLQLYVPATNRQAKALYQRCGFHLVQEIWRLDLEPLPGTRQPPDPSCAPETNDRLEVLESGHHHLAMETESLSDTLPGEVKTA